MKNVNKFLTIGKAILLVLAIIYVGSLVDFIFKPFKALTGVILIPMLLAVFSTISCGLYFLCWKSGN